MKKPHFFEQGLSTNKSPCTLHDAEIGRLVRITALQGEPAVCQRLREMGFCELSEICKVAHSSALICRTCGGKVALSKNLAKNILVEKIDCPLVKE